MDRNRICRACTVMRAGQLTFDLCCGVGNHEAYSSREFVWPKAERHWSVISEVNQNRKGGCPWVYCTCALTTWIEGTGFIGTFANLSM